jgi:hypothetical protein
MGQGQAKFFHTLGEDGEIDKQGVVLERGNGRVVVELFSWITGEPTSEETFTELETARWKFYRTKNQWLNANDKAFDGEYLRGGDWRD